MKRGEIWTLKDEGYASKARPVVVIQDDEGGVFQSVILCLFTSYYAESVDTRVTIEPSAYNGLKKTSYVMTDKIVTVRKEELGSLCGNLSDIEMHKVSRQLAKILHITEEDLN
jgi:mRNA interferase MazF